MYDLNQNKLTFQTIWTNSISNLSKTYSIKKAAGINNVSARFVKGVADVLAIPIIQICNLSIKLSHFLKDCEYAKLIKPLFKMFRPIKLLPVVSQIITTHKKWKTSFCVPCMEKVIHNQTIDYPTENNNLCRYQCSFRKNHSAYTSPTYWQIWVLVY